MATYTMAGLLKSIPRMHRYNDWITNKIIPRKQKHNGWMTHIESRK